MTPEHLAALQLVVVGGVVGGVFSLAGVLLGGFLTPLTQLNLEKKREQRLADRAKLLIAAELLHAQMILRTASEGKHWPYVEDVNGFLPTSAWRENRSDLAGKVNEELWNQLVMAYALLENDRARFVVASRLPPESTLERKQAEEMKSSSNNLGRLRRQLGLGGGWRDEFDEPPPPAPRTTP